MKRLIIFIFPEYTVQTHLDLRGKVFLLLHWSTINVSITT
jgi:hypothetical protein